MTRYHVSDKPNGSWYGTFTLEELAEAVATGRIGEDWVATEDKRTFWIFTPWEEDSKWVKISELLKSHGITLPEPVAAPAPTPTPTSVTVTPSQLPVQTPSEAPVASGAHQESTSWVYIIEGQQTKGPFTMGQLRSMWSIGSITVMTMHCRADDPQWKPLSSILHLLEPSPSAINAAGGGPIAAPQAVAQPAGPSGVGGWLTFFCVGLTILAPLCNFSEMFLNWSKAKPVFTAYPSIEGAVFFESIAISALLIYGFIVGCRIWRGDSQGRSLAQRYLLIGLFGGVLLMIITLLLSVDLPKDFRAEFNKGALFGLIAKGVWFTVWWAYFKKSNRVRNTYGEERT